MKTIKYYIWVLVEGKKRDIEVINDGQYHDKEELRKNYTFEVGIDEVVGYDGFWR